MKLPGKHCIVCQRPIRKRVTDIFVRPVSGSTGGPADALVHADLKSQVDCKRYTNAPYILSSSRNAAGLITRFSTWDGVSFQDRYFCTNRCAISQGYASADSGQRFTWKNAR